MSDDSDLGVFLIVFGLLVSLCLAIAGMVLSYSYGFYEGRAKAQEQCYEQFKFPAPKPTPKTVQE